MGSAESATRKVSFGVDDEDRVRILRGVKLSEDVLQRMRGVANIAPEPTASSTSTQKDTGASHSDSPGSRRQAAPPHHPSTPDRPDSVTKEDQWRDEQKQKLREEQREREAVKREMIKALSRERLHTHQEAEKAKQLSAEEIEGMAQQLQKKDSQLKALDAFYKEQLAQLEKRNLERYEQSKEQFHQAATKAEASVRSRSTDPVCVGLQAQILSCYRENREQTLRCSDLAKEYMQCVNASKKKLLVNRG